MAHHIIYIPGLGDSRTYNQNHAVRLWKHFGLQAHYMPLGWSNNEGFSKKLNRLTDKIDELQQKGHTVSLVGVSAGASAVLAAYAKRPQVHSVITIAGKINRPEAVGNSIFRSNPDFKEALSLVKPSLETLRKQVLLPRILCLYNKLDITVPPKDAVIHGVKSKAVAGWGHVSAIFFSVIFESRTIARFVRQLPALETTSQKHQNTL